VGLRAVLNAMVKRKIPSPRRESKPRTRWWNNIKMNFKEIRYSGVDCIQIGQGRNQWRAIVNIVKILRLLLDQLNDFQLLKKDSAPLS
jgi:hypothetical protein